MYFQIEILMSRVPNGPYIVWLEDRPLSRSLFLLDPGLVRDWVSEEQD